MPCGFQRRSRGHRRSDVRDQPAFPLRILRSLRRRKIRSALRRLLLRRWSLLRACRERRKPEPAPRETLRANATARERRCRTRLLLHGLHPARWRRAVRRAIRERGSSPLRGGGIPGSSRLRSRRTRPALLEPGGCLRALRAAAQLPSRLRRRWAHLRGRWPRRAWPGRRELPRRSHLLRIVRVAAEPAAVARSAGISKSTRPAAGSGCIREAGRRAEFG